MIYLAVAVAITVAFFIGYVEGKLAGINKANEILDREWL